MLRTLVISSDSQLVDAVEPTLRDLEFEMDVKPTIPDGADKLRYLRYNALVLDCSAGRLWQVQQTRDTWLNPDPALIAVAERDLYSCDLDDADAIWRLPLLPGEMYRTLLNVRAKATGDRRLRRRCTPHRASSVRYSYDGQNFHQATIVDVTETGLAVESLEPLVPGCAIHLEFRLPAMLSSIQTLADVVWRNDHRRAGLRFLQMPREQHRQLERWLNQLRLGMSSGYSYGY